jgi:uncharacterized membrane protein YhhN
MLLALPVFFAAAALAALYAWRYNPATPTLRRTVIKVGSVGLLGLAALLGDGPGLLMLGLVLSAIGDACLAQDDSQFLLYGMGAFFAAQLSYLLLFLNTGGALFTGPLEGGAQALLIVATAGMLVWLWPKLKEMAAPVAIYAVAVLAMALFAVGLPGFAMVSLGAVLFFVSDGILAAELFALPQDSRQRLWTTPGVWALYWGGQALITAGFLAPIV